MLSFPSALNTGGANFSPIGKQLLNAGASTLNVYTKTGKVSQYDTSRLTSININLNATTKDELSNYQSLPVTNDKFIPWYRVNLGNKQNGRNRFGGSATTVYESPWNIPGEVIHAMNNYNWVYKTNALNYMGSEKTSAGLEYYISQTVVSPSIFNPAYNVQRIGFTGNVPLLMNAQNTGGESENLTDCSIKELVRCSHIPKGILGNARYRYADFMYCKDLGKVSNNHLITLRKFPHPIGDNIFEIGDNEGDIGRLVAWFDTDDNKLENIINYNYHATWKELHSKIQPEESQEEDPNRGIIGKLANTFSPKYNNYLNGGAGYGGNSFVAQAWNWLGTKTIHGLKDGFVVPTDAGRKTVLYTNYDQNKVYEPKDTVQDTHIYEGKLVFNQDITLVFSYKLRAYDNINPKSAFLDLIGNILEVTYRRGKFWGGEQKIIGPSAQNNSAYQKAYNFVDNTFDKMGGLLEAFSKCGWDFGAIIGNASNFIKSVGMDALKTFDSISGGNIVEAGKNVFNSVVNGGSIKDNASKFLKTLNDYTGFSSAGKAAMKNALGRPSLYAFDSLLTGDPVGLWHLTIGNPKNPIMSIGNLILEDATITQGGPLGVDDFPTDLKVTIKLKHAKSRDLVDVAKMYTKGTSGIYIVPEQQRFSDFAEGTSGQDADIDDIEEKQIKNDSISDPAQKTEQSNDANDKNSKTTNNTENNNTKKSKAISKDSGISEKIKNTDNLFNYMHVSDTGNKRPYIEDSVTWLIEKYNTSNIFKAYVAHKN